jgi:hypothetical protein
LIPRPASADRELLNPMGERGTLVIDQVSGFRVSSISGINYAGPFGFSTQRFSLGSFQQGGGSTVYHFTSVWFSPSADIFVIDHLSVGGLIELTNTSTSVDVPQPGGGSQSSDLPNITNITFLPRVGWLFGVTDRIGVWPRIGFGYGSRQFNEGNPPNTIRNSVTFPVFSVDVGVLYRFTEGIFVRLAPEISTSLGGTRSATSNAGEQSAKASVFQFAIVSGLGVMLDL